MLKKIPSILSPELLKILMEMGHGDEIVIADGNFPSASCAQRLVRLDGHGVPEILDAVLSLLPLDAHSDHKAWLMEVVPGDSCDSPRIWDTYAQITSRYEHDFNGFGSVERFTFYERAKQAYAIIATGESALYANIILRKGVVSPA
jgi:L-fucose mutarotase